MDASAAFKRINKESEDLAKLSSVDFTVEPIGGDIYKQQVTFRPSSGPFAGGAYKGVLEFPNDYPFTKPSFKFTSRMYHPNVAQGDGNVCMKLLKEWHPQARATGPKPGSGDPSLLQVIANFLVTPETADPLEADIAKMYLENRGEFKKKAAEIVKANPK